MKQLIEQNLAAAVGQFLEGRNVPQELVPPLVIDYVKDTRHGDLASNIAMLLAKPAAMPPRMIAEVILEYLPATPGVEKTEIAGPGFINFFLS